MLRIVLTILRRGNTALTDGIRGDWTYGDGSGKVLSIKAIGCYH